MKYPFAKSIRLSVFRIGDIANRTDFANVRIVRASAIAGGEMPNIKYIDNNEHKFSV